MGAAKKMNTTVVSIGVAVAAATLAMSGCGASGSPAGGEPTASTKATALSHGGPVRDQVSLIDHLRADGVRVDISGATTRPFLRAKGTRLQLSGGQLAGSAPVEVYNYDSTDLGTDGSAAAQRDAAAIAPDGTPKTGQSLSGPVHFFRADRVLVLYAGADTTVTGTLTDLLGRQFAGT